jgi:sporulation protein YlmC with PRC-barrel domain
MLRSLKDLEGYRVSATDGDLGTVANFLLDDESWTIRYLVVHTGGFFSERDVLISPIFLGKVEWASRHFQLDLTKEKIRQSPGTDTDLPVSRQHERDYYTYYGYPNYWGSTGIWRMAATEPMDTLGIEPSPAPHQGAPADDSHLRSAKFIRGYHIQGADGEIGHVDDFIVDDETWEIRYLVVNTSNWWVGKEVLVSPFWATQISWEASLIELALTRKEIQNCPEWNADAPVNRAYEERLFDYYGRPVYWDKSHPTGAGEPLRHGVPPIH